MKKVLKRNNAITLIALVITIVILIILAGVSFNLLLGENGLIAKARVAKDDTQKEAAIESLKLKMLDCQMESYGEKGNLPTLAYLAAFLQQDKDVEYVQSESRPMASIDENPYADWDKIYTKLEKYPYEFEINSNFQVAINGESIGNVIPAGYMKTPGDDAIIEITENGDNIDVLNYKYAKVNVSTGNLNDNINDVWVTLLKKAGIGEPEQYNNTAIFKNESIMNSVVSSNNAIDYLANSKGILMAGAVNSNVAMTKLGTNNRFKREIINNEDWRISIAESKYRNNFCNYAINNANTLIGVISGRSYYKKNDGFALAGAFSTNSGTNTFVLVGKDPDSVIGYCTYDVNNPSRAKQIQYDNETWYYAELPYIFTNNTGSFTSFDNCKNFGSIDSSNYAQVAAETIINDFLGTN